MDEIIDRLNILLASFNIVFKNTSNGKLYSLTAETLDKSDRGVKDDLVILLMILGK